MDNKERMLLKRTVGVISGPVELAMRQADAHRLVAILVAALILVGCDKRSGDAIILSKEHIAATAAPVEPAATPPLVATPSQTDPAETEQQPGEIHQSNDITVDSYAMSPEIRGTSRDPRALKDEQWLVEVKLTSGGRRFNVPTDRSQFDKLKAGDQVHVRYRVGKYTNTIWAAEIDSPK